MDTTTNNQTMVWVKPEIDLVPTQKPSSKNNCPIDQDPLKIEDLKTDYCEPAINPPILIPEILDTMLEPDEIEMKVFDEDYIVTRHESIDDNLDKVVEDTDLNRLEKSTNSPKLRPKCGIIKKSERLKLKNIERAKVDESNRLKSLRIQDESKKLIKKEKDKKLKPNKVNTEPITPKKRLCLEDSDKKIFKIFCNQCEFTCKDIETMMTHSRSHFEQTVSIKDTTIEYNEIEIIHSIALFRCSLCNEFWKRLEEFTEHLSIHGKGSKTEPHILRFKTVTNCSCEVCSEEFESTSMFNTRKLGGMDYYKCNECPVLFSKRKALEEHKTRCHLKLVCEICAFTCNTKSKFEYHMARHPGLIIDPYKCPECPKTFKTQMTWAQHKKRHKESKVACEICKAVVTPSALSRHMKIHFPGEKKHKCTICPKEFNGSEQLKRHVNIHTGEHMFRCDTCYKSFNRASNLQMHLSVHTGLKEFICESCGSAFRVAVSLRNHIAKYHPVTSESSTSENNK